MAISAALLCLMPLPLVAAVATSANWQQGGWLSGISWRWMAESFGTIMPTLGYSLRLALLVWLLNIAVGLPAAWALARRRFRGRRLLLAGTALPIAIPGIALALALTLAFPTWRAGGWLLLLGHVLYTLPFFVAAIVPVIGHPALREREQVAATLGAGALTRLVHIVLPALRSALLAATIIVITLSMGEFNVSFFLFTPLDRPLPIDLYANYSTGRLEQAAAYTIWFLACTVPAAIAIESLGGTRLGQAGGAQRAQLRFSLIT
ncbi:ABC transporter permease subunit [Candidatus Gracilibacteria bacterium]|nr:ABC transporter permease subunit [Candidatus Gracilibacteria bacterium]